MQKVKMTICYDGSQYFGSQIQPHKKTVQGDLYEVFKVLNIPKQCDMSGRTDKDVHAFKQVVSFSLPDHFKNLKELKKRFNKLLPSSIYIRDIQFADDQFHARFSAKKREYRYIFTDKLLTPFNSKYISYFENINLDLIKETLDLFTGEHDFEYFSKTGSEPHSTIRKIYKIDVYKYQDVYILRFVANAYLRSQIRMMVDAIMKVSSKKLTIEQIKEQLDKKNKHTWTLASASGLYLSKIHY